MVDCHAKVVVVKGCSLVWLLLSAELYSGRINCGGKAKRRLENARVAQSECIAFSFFSRFVLNRRFQSELKKETSVCFFRATEGVT